MMSNRIFNKKLWLWLLPIIILASFGAIWFLSQQNSQPVLKEESSWILVEPQLLVQQVGIVGRIAPAELRLVNSPFEGNVDELLVSEGSEVEEGDPLLRLATSQIDIQLREALAQRLQAQNAFSKLQSWDSGHEVARARRMVSTARLNLNDTERRLIEIRTLHEKGIVPRMELEAIQQQVTMQRFDLEAAEAELVSTLDQGSWDYRRIAEIELENATARYEELLLQREGRILKAPFSGIIMPPVSLSGEIESEPVQNGARVTQGQPLFTLASTDRIHVDAKVEEVDINMLDTGQTVTVTGDAFAEIELVGTLVSIGAHSMESRNNNSGASYPLTVIIPPLSPEEQRYIRLGMSAHLHITTYSSENAMVVPPEAILNDENVTYVMHRASIQEKPRRINISIGQITPTGIEVFGLPPGLVGL